VLVGRKIIKTAQVQMLPFEPRPLQQFSRSIQSMKRLNRVKCADDWEEYPSLEEWKIV